MERGEAIVAVASLLLFLGLIASPVVIALSIATKRGWFAVTHMIVIAGLLVWSQYNAEHSPEAAARAQYSAMRVYMALTFLLFCLPGLVMATAMARHWSFTTTVSVVAGIIFGLMALAIVWQWDQPDTTIETWRQYVNDNPDKFGKDKVPDLLNTLAYLRDNKYAFTFGVGFTSALIVSMIYSSITGAVMRLGFRRPGFSSTFKDFRPTEWLIWATIAAAIGCLVEHYSWPNPALRAVSWNTAIALAAVYWFSGLAIVVYGIHVLRPSPLAVAGFMLVVFMLVMTGTLPVLSLIGLFDTWGDYRRKLDLLAEAHKSDGTQPPPLH